MLPWILSLAGNVPTFIQLTGIEPHKIHYYVKLHWNLASSFQVKSNYLIQKVQTSNVIRHRGFKRKRSFVCWYMAPPGECYYNTLLCCDYFSPPSVVSHAFSAQCMYSKFGHHPHLLGHPCIKFSFFHGLYCWANSWRKIAYSITHSCNHSPSLFEAPGTEALALWKIALKFKVTKI